MCYTNDMDYSLLDSGDGKKLEVVGPYRLVRPAPQAIWSSHRTPGEWSKADAVYERAADGGGAWEWNRRVDREFDILFCDLAFRIKLTDFGHLGLFPEQAATWTWLREQIRSRLKGREGEFRVLNLFAYTGGSTLAASQAGAQVVHVDAAKGVVDWARENARLAHLDSRPIRWIVDDALKFAQREVRRGSRYHAIILDPPSFGRGPKGQVFKIEDQILPLLDSCRQLLARDARFLLYTCHTPGFTPLVMHNQLEEFLGERGGAIEAGEMTIVDEQARHLPAGTFARWVAG